MQEAKSAIEATGIELHVGKVLLKGITESSPASRVKTDISLMLRIEAALLASKDGFTLPSLGYGGAESLYCMDGGNAPNSVFPIFWWPWLADGNQRETLLNRAESA
jgi:hypothetical protein